MSEPEPSTPVLPGAADALRTALTEVGYSQFDADQWADRLSKEPPANFHSLDFGLGEVDVLDAAEVKPLIAEAIKRLPLSVQADLERRGLLYHPTALRGLADLGARLRQLDAQIADEQKRNPDGQKLKELYVKRHGAVARGVEYAF